MARREKRLLDSAATLAVSDFVPTIYFGVLASLSIIGGLVGDLGVLPMLIGLIAHGKAGA